MIGEMLAVITEDPKGKIIKPYLPEGAKQDIRDWTAKNKNHKAFYRVIPQMNASCQNCGDALFLMVSFARSGPYSQVPGHRRGESLTWFDGSQSAGAGWYIVARTMQYDCPHCRGE